MGSQVRISVSDMFAQQQYGKCTDSSLRFWFTSYQVCGQAGLKIKCSDLLFSCFQSSHNIFPPSPIQMQIIFKNNKQVVLI